MKKKTNSKSSYKIPYFRFEFGRRRGDRKTFSVTLATQRVYNSTFKTKRKYDGRNGGMEDVFE